MEKIVWTDKNYEEMSWHLNTLYAVSLPDKKFTFCLDIDYIMEWIKPLSNTSYKMKVVPCILTFHNVISLKIDLDLGNYIGIEINDIIRSNRKNVHGQYFWDYTIDFNNYRKIIFTATGFKQEMRGEPIIGISRVYKERTLEDYKILTE